MLKPTYKAIVKTGGSYTSDSRNVPRCVLRKRVVILHIYCKFGNRKHKLVFVPLFVSFSGLGSDKCFTLANQNNMSFLNGNGHIN